MPTAGAEHRQARRDPLHAHRVLARLPRHQHGPEAAGGDELTINLVPPDIGEKYLVELRNATLTNIEGFQSPKPDLTLTLNRADLNRVMLGVASFDDLGPGRQGAFEGDRTAIYKLAT